MKRLLIVVVAVAVFAAVLFAHREARAQTAPTNPPTMVLQIINSDGSFTDMTSTDLQNFFDAAHCDCHTQFGLQLELDTTLELPTDPLQVWIGNMCDDLTDPTAQVADCTKVLTIPDITMIQNKAVTYPIDAAEAMIVGIHAGQACPAVENSVSIFAFVEEADAILPGFDWVQTPAIVVDTQPPIAPTSLTAQGGESAVVLNWVTDDSATTDLLGYQVLCMSTTTGLPIFKSPTSGPQYRRTEDVCMETMPTSDIDAGVGAPIDAGAVADARIVADAAPRTADGGPVTNGDFDSLDPSYICSGLISPSSTSTRVDVSGATLAKDEEIFTKLVAIDNSLNYTSIDADQAVALVPVRDFAEYYKDNGGKADGGYCFVATAAYGDYDSPYVRVLRAFRDRTLAKFAIGRDFIRWYYAHSPRWAAWLRAHPVGRFGAAVLLFPVVCWAAILTYTVPRIVLGVLLLGVLAFRLRRRLVRVLPVAILVAGVGLARGAHAQVMLDDEEEEKGFVLPQSDWVFELKGGLFKPNVDSAPGFAKPAPPGVTGTPFASMFGNSSSFLPEVEIDRFFLWPKGQLGVAAQLGFYSRTADAFQQDPITGLSNGKRSPADTTGMHVIPFSISAVYRFTMIADETVIPVVPYVKLGLSWYPWWITKGGGAIASFSPGNSANGATIGWQGTFGISVRADRFDPDAAHSLESEMGVEHAGFFFELTFADVEGLWEKNRLYVGDGFWSAGVNFEF